MEKENDSKEEKETAKDLLDKASEMILDGSSVNSEDYWFLKLSGADKK